MEYQLPARCTALALALVVAGCSAPTGPPTEKSPKPTYRAAPECTVPSEDFRDMATCVGAFEVFETEIADTREDKSVARIAVASEDARVIFAAMADEAVQLSLDADSVTVFAYASETDYRAGAGFNRGRIFWNNRGPIEVKICNEFADLGGGIDSCANEYTFMVENR